jgi:hypothetical protein
MSLKKQIQVAGLQILGVNIGPQDSQWGQISIFAESFTPDLVLKAFESWAKDQGARVIPYPLSEFVRVAPRMIINVSREDESPVDQAALDELCSELYLVGGPAFSGKTRDALAELVKTYSPEEIKAAYAELIAGFDDFEMRRATKVFAEGGGTAVLIAGRKRKEQLKQQQELIDRTRKVLLETAAAVRPVELEPPAELPEA